MCSISMFVIWYLSVLRQTKVLLMILQFAASILNAEITARKYLPSR
jgi:hypothetical protein